MTFIFVHGGNGVGTALGASKLTAVCATRGPRSPFGIFLGFFLSRQSGGAGPGLEQEMKRVLLSRHLLDTNSVTDLRGGLIRLYHKPAREVPCAHFIDEETEACVCVLGGGVKSPGLGTHI